MMNTEEIGRKRSAAKQLVIEMGQVEAIGHCEKMAKQALDNIRLLPCYNGDLIDEYQEQERHWNQMKDLILHNL